MSDDTETLNLELITDHFTLFSSINFSDKYPTRGKTNRKKKSKHFSSELVIRKTDMSRQQTNEYGA